MFLRHFNFILTIKMLNHYKKEGFILMIKESSQKQNLLKIILYEDSVENLIINLIQ